MIIVLMGVTGAGKTTVGQRLADELGWRFVDGDDLHPPGNIAKLREGTPLTDADREPWLHQLQQRMASWIAGDESVVLACSALKKHYRHVLLEGRESHVQLVYLKGSAETFQSRLEGRQGHFMSKHLLPSQLDLLEEPEEPNGALVVEADASVERIVAHIRSSLIL